LADSANYFSQNKEQIQYMPEPITTADMATIQRNLESFLLRNLPETHITRNDRIIYAGRVAASEDVYAYGDETIGYYIWDTDTRIILPKLSDIQWTLTGYSFVVGSTWSITIRQESTGILHSIEINLPTCKNADHAERLVKVLIGHVNKWGADPLGYNGCSFNG
jgi:hypothetical protein